ncbi:Plastocyanin [bacterium HR32]|jgi:plastocyanin|nr:Plastocyanin [bacterium HR32]
MRKRWQRVVVLVVLAGLGLPVLPAPAQAPATWTVVAGGLRDQGAVFANAFFPRVLDVHVGDTVVWQFAGFHNVAFTSGQAVPPLVVEEGGKRYLNPQVVFPQGPRTYDGSGYRNSGTPPEDPKEWARFRYALTFTKPGTYTYVCIIHGPAMSGAVRVHPAGERLPLTPTQALQRARQEQAASLRAGEQALGHLRAQVAGGGVRVRMVGDAQKGYSLMRYTRDPVVVRAGTTVTWEMADPFEIHTVTFVGGGPVPPFVVPQPQSSGPPKLLLNPKVAVPTPDKEYAGSGYANSGILTPLGAPGPHTYSLRFTRPGTYTYWCPIHAALGMKGVVVVK